MQRESTATVRLLKRKLNERFEVLRQRINYKVIARATSDNDVEIGIRGAIRIALADCIV